MLKYIGVLVRSRSVLFYSILLSIFINQKALAQINIEDEVILSDGSVLEEVSLTMPFYGKVTGSVNPYAIQLYGLELVTIQAGNQTKNIGPACNGNTWQTNWEIEGVTMGSVVSVVVYKGCEGGSPTAADYWFEPGGVYYYCNSRFPRIMATTINFSEQPPPDCGYAEPCDNYNGNPFSLVTNPLNNQVVQNNSICNEKPDRLGFTKPITSRQFSDIFTFSIEEVEICFDRQNQKLHFELNQDPRINILSDICWDKIRDTYTHPNWIEINDISQINDQVIPCSQYWDAVRSIKGYYSYPPKLPANPNKAFIFTEILLLHEDSHVKHYNDDYVQYYINLLYHYIKDWDRTCSNFDNISAAQESALDFTKLKIDDYNKFLYFHYQWDRGYAFDNNHNNIIPEDVGENWRSIGEQKTHDRKEVQDLIDQYRAAILNLCQH